MTFTKKYSYNIPINILWREINMKLNQTLRTQILDEHGRIYLQTTTDERKKLDEEVETFKSLRLASHEIVKKMCYEFFGIKI